METIQGPSPSSIRQSTQDIIGCLCKWMLKFTSKHVTSVNYSNIPSQLSKYLTPMVAPWPFAQWGLDILGLFPITMRQMKFLVVGIDYFTKWVEAEPVARITKQNVRSFVQKNIVCHFGIPRVLISDNEHQFDNTSFREFCKQLGIRNYYFSPSHPQANGQAEVAN